MLLALKCLASKILDTFLVPPLTDPTFECFEYTLLGVLTLIFSIISLLIETVHPNLDLLDSLFERMAEALSMKDTSSLGLARD